MKNLLKKLIYKLDKALDMPKYRIKCREIIARPVENGIIFSKITKKDDPVGFSFKMTYEDYFYIRDQIKSYRKKHGNISDIRNSQS